MMDDVKASFRKVLGHYPTGVCAITAMSPEGVPAAMIVGSFTSVSLDSPLVSFFPDKQSSNWSALSPCDGFCVNCSTHRRKISAASWLPRTRASWRGRAFPFAARRTPDRRGMAWIDCSTHSVSEARDHLLVLGAVDSFDIAGEGDPLLFHKGSYGKVASLQPAA